MFNKKYLIFCLSEVGFAGTKIKTFIKGIGQDAYECDEAVRFCYENNKDMEGSRYKYVPIRAPDLFSQRLYFLRLARSGSFKNKPSRFVPADIVILEPYNKDIQGCYSITGVFSRVRDAQEHYTESSVPVILLHNYEQRMYYNSSIPDDNLFQITDIDIWGKYE